MEDLEEFSKIIPKSGARLKIKKIIQDEKNGYKLQNVRNYW